MRTLLTWVDRRQALPAQRILAGRPGRSTELARNLLDGIVATDERELSGIWSTASGVADRVPIRSSRWRPPPTRISTPRSSCDRRTPSTSPLRPIARRMVAPDGGGLIDDIRHATYARSAERRRRVDVPGHRWCWPSTRWPTSPRSPTSVDDQRRRRPGPGHVGVPAGPVTGPEPVAGPCRRVPLAVRDHGGAPGHRGRADPRGALHAGRRRGDPRPARSRPGGRRPTTCWPTWSPGGVPSEARACRPSGGGGFRPTSSPGARRATRLAFDERNRPAWIPLTPAHTFEPWRSLRGPDRTLGRQARPGAEVRGSGPRPRAMTVAPHRSQMSPRTSTGSVGTARVTSPSGVMSPRTWWSTSSGDRGTTSAGMGGDPTTAERARGSRSTARATSPADHRGSGPRCRTPDHPYGGGGPSRHVPAGRRPPPPPGRPPIR